MFKWCESIIVKYIQPVNRPEKNWIIGDILQILSWSLNSLEIVL